MKRFPMLLATVSLLTWSPAHAQGPDSATGAVAAARPAAMAWLALMDHGKFGEAWDSAATLFRKAITRQAWNEAATKARDPFGAFGSRERLVASFVTKPPNAPPGQYVVLQFRTRVKHGTTVVETVTPMKDADGRWRVSGYYIRPEQGH